MIYLTQKPLDTEALTATVGNPGNGSVITFLGVTRDQTEGRQVLWLEYEAYPTMAEKMLGRVAEEVRERWGIERLSIAHRTGRLEIGEVSLAVAVGSPHRAEGFAACAYVVDRIKENVPIWKKEVFANGEVWVGMEGHRHAVAPER
ncbi:MAG: molybdenum cofactor biosynthesis protein MoaE [Chloroflexi bacterium]|nr:molybdenum cofactor biosynthesis protein MoaE [Chloroflexota bacterium]